MNTAQAQLGAVLAAGGPELTRAARPHRGAAGRGGRGPRRGAGPALHVHALGRRQAAAPDAGLPVRERRRRRAAGRGAARRGAAAHGDARARRRARQRAAAARPPDGLRRGRAAGGHHDRRPALLARLRRARVDRQPRGRALAVRGFERARARRADAAGRRLEQRRRRRSAIWSAAGSRRRACSALRAGWARCSAAGPRWRTTLCRFGESIGLAFQMLDDVLDVAGSWERTGKPRGTDLLDGTVTLPLILARERDPGLAELDPALTPEQAERDLRADRRDRSPGRGARAGARARGAGEAVAGRAGPAAASGARPSSWSPTAWSSATPKRRARSLPAGSRRP